MRNIFATESDYTFSMAQCSRARKFALLLAVCAGALGCNGGAASPDAEQTPTDLAFIDCSKETRATPYAPGTVVKSSSGALAVELVENRPGTAEANKPPGTWVKGSNNWTIEVRDGASQQPIDGLEVVATPRMPDHGHGTSIAPVTTDQGGGRYLISPLYLYMSGYWQITLDVRPPATDASSTLQRQTVVFHVCIPG